MAKKPTREQKRKQELKRRHLKAQSRARSGSSASTCGVCGRELHPDPSPPLEAAMFRHINVRALGPERGDLFAYCFAKSTVIVTSDNQDKLCECDLANWNAAHDEYQTKGAAACWASLGVTEHVMRQAEAQNFIERINDGQQLSAEEKQRASELEAYFTQYETRGGSGIFAHRPKSPPRDPNRKRATRVISADDDPLFPYEEYMDAKYEGEDPNEVLGALCALEDHGVERAAEFTGRSPEWIERWAKLYGSEQVARDLDFSNPFVRALLELSKLYPDDFRDLWEDEEAAQPEIEATPMGRQNTVLFGFPFVRGRVETAELAAERELSRQFRATRKSRPIRVE